MSGRTRIALAAAVAALSLAVAAAPAHAEPPIIICPVNMTVDANVTGGAIVTPAPATASDPDGDAVTITVFPGAGFYGLGTHVVTYIATDSSGESATCTSTINVFDFSAPSITCPSGITAAAPAGGTAVVTYSAQASDVADDTPTVTFFPESGSAFSIGTTFVTATATDDSGNSASCTFTVTVNQLVPTSKAECKNGGWKAFGTMFKNQGECVDLFGT
jgi:hypothetical protein